MLQLSPFQNLSCFTLALLYKGHFWPILEMDVEDPGSSTTVSQVVPVMCEVAAWPRSSPLLPIFPKRASSAGLNNRKSSGMGATRQEGAHPPLDFLSHQRAAEMAGKLCQLLGACWGGSMDMMAALQTEPKQQEPCKPVVLNWLDPHSAVIC